MSSSLLHAQRDDQRITTCDRRRCRTDPAPGPRTSIHLSPQAQIESVNTEQCDSNPRTLQAPSSGDPCGNLGITGNITGITGLQDSRTTPPIPGFDISRSLSGQQHFQGEFSSLRPISLTNHRWTARLLLRGRASRGSPISAAPAPQPLLLTHHHLSIRIGALKYGRTLSSSHHRQLDKSHQYYYISVRAAHSLFYLQFQRIPNNSSSRRPLFQDSQIHRLSLPAHHQQQNQIWCLAPLHPSSSHIPDSPPVAFVSSSPGSAILATPMVPT